MWKLKSKPFAVQGEPKVRETVQLEKVEMREPLGKRIYSFRRAKGLKLSQTAEMCGVSEATMSRIETGQTDISAHHLFVLANELGVDVAEFFASEARPLTAGMRSITRKADAGSHKLARYVSQVLSSDLSHKDMHPAINHVTATSLDEVGGLWSHRGEEFLYVLSGAIFFHSEFYVPVVLEQGDSIYFEGTMNHAYLRSGDEPASILVVVGPPKGFLK